MYLEKVLSISNSSKYAKWYEAIIARAYKNQEKFLGYGEKHHVLPKSFKLGGEKDPHNIVKLSAREHFICHLLLARMFDGRLHFSMINAAIFLKGLHKRCNASFRINSRLYEALKRELSRLSKTRVFSKNTLNKMSQSGKKRHQLAPFSADTREKLRKINIEQNPQSMKIVIEGIEYFSHQHAMRELGVSLKNLRKIAEGKCSTIEEAIQRKKPTITKPMGGNSTKRKIVTFDGVEYSSIRAFAKSKEISYTHARMLIQV